VLDVEFRMSDKDSNIPYRVTVRSVSQYEIDSNIIMYSNAQFREPVIFYILSVLLYYELLYIFRNADDRPKVITINKLIRC